MMPDYYPTPIKCDFCGGSVIFTSNASIYGRKYGNGKCYKCTNCDAYVGVHTGTKIPLGRLANRELRELKKRCHEIFDLTWKNKINATKKRNWAYKKLAKLLSINEHECHFGWFDKPMLKNAIMYMESEEWKIEVKQC